MLPPIHVLAALLLAANPVGSVNVVVAWKQDQTEVALRKIDLTGLKVVEVTGLRASCRGDQSSATVALHLTEEPEFVYAFADIPCETYLVAWRGSKTKETVELMRSWGVNILHRGETLPFAVCKGPLTAELQEWFRNAPSVETVEPDMGPPPEPKE